MQQRTQKRSVVYVEIGGGAQCFAQPRSLVDMLETLSLRSASKPTAAHLVQCQFDVRRGFHYAPATPLFIFGYEKHYAVHISTDCMMGNLWKRYIFIDYCSIDSIKDIKEINDNS